MTFRNLIRYSFVAFLILLIAFIGALTSAPLPAPSEQRVIGSFIYEPERPMLDSKYTSSSELVFYSRNYIERIYFPEKDAIRASTHGEICAKIICTKPHITFQMSAVNEENDFVLDTTLIVYQFKGQKPVTTYSWQWEQEDIDFYAKPRLAENLVRGMVEHHDTTLKIGFVDSDGRFLASDFIDLANSYAAIYSLPCINEWYYNWYPEWLSRFAKRLFKPVGEPVSSPVPQ